MASITGGVGLGGPGRMRGPGQPRPTKITTQPRSTRYGFGPSPRVGPSGGVPIGPNPKPPKAPKAAAPPAAPASTPGPAPAAAGAPPTAPGYPSPYDSTYWTDLAAATNAANQRIGVYNADIANGQTSLNTTLAQLARNQALQTTADQNAENSRGGFAQGALGHTLGVLAQNTQEAQAANQTKYSQNAAAWNSAIAGVRQGLSVEQIALAAASAARQAALGQTAPAATAPAATAGVQQPGTAAGRQGQAKAAHAHALALQAQSRQARNRASQGGGSGIRWR